MDKLHDITKHPDYGKRIEGSRFYRSFCPRCLSPVRVTLERLTFGEPVFCELCDPPHKGCNSPSSVVNDIEHDTDAFCPSWKQS